ncbi:MAG TPA: hypothetical protein VMP00_07395 [Burkholderiales bacterium]|nr:hypothetical protein [Burkholderiales bacterium]
MTGIRGRPGERQTPLHKTPVTANGVAMDDEKALLLRAQVDF